MQSFTLADYDEAAQAIQRQTTHRPAIGLILGSGLSPLADQIEDAVAIPYAQIPHFAVSTVAGHAGRMVIGRLAGATVCVMQGRLHFYEGYSLQQVTFPIRVMRRMGIDTLILTNAAGGLNPTFSVGDLMLITDHINLLGMTGANPLLGPNLDAFGTRFPATNRIYTPALRTLAHAAADAQKLPLREGVYIALSGPSFETAAEVRMLRGWGADAVGMSTAPEALVAHHAGMAVLGVSTITNIAIDQLDAAGEPSHEEVTEAGKIIVPKLINLLKSVLTGLPDA